MTVKEMKEVLSQYSDECEISLSVLRGRAAYETSIIIRDGITEEGGRTLLRQVLYYDPDSAHPKPIIDCGYTDGFAVI